MTREELIYEVCPYKSMINCHSEEPYTHFKCKDCSILMNKWFDEYDKHVIEQYKEDTNYDVDKVVEELELHSFELGTDTLPVHYVRLNEAIEIVKQGGVSEE